MNENEIGKIIVDSAITVHRGLGPGLLESVYEVVLAHELEQCSLLVNRQVSIPITYNGINFNEGFKADIIVENKVIIELKSIESISKAHKKQVLTYLKLTNYKLGYLLNFGRELMKDGLSRIINGENNS
jgi:GxxExxY protein